VNTGQEGTPMTELEGDEFTELVDGDFPRIDLVKAGANGLPFLIAKSQADTNGGLLPGELVRGLLGSERGPEAQHTKEGDVTISGSPAAVMKMIHEAAQRASAPTEKGGDAVKDDVTKAEGPDVEVADLVAEAPGGSTAETVPGSPDWEQLDAETAQSVVSVLGRAQRAIEWLAEREATEAVTGADPDDADNAVSLSDLACQIECAIRGLAGFAATEVLEAEVDDEMGDVAKGALVALGGGGLTAVVEASGVIERFAPIAKAGRVLSSANEAAIRAASESLQKVLASLPAPITDDQPVAKEKESTVDEPTTPDVAPAEPVEKAKGDPQMAVFDESGKLVGTIDPADLSPIATPSSAAADDAASADDAPADAPAADDPAAAPAAAAPVDDAAVIPGTDTVAAPAPTEDDTVQKAAHSLAAGALAEVLAPLAEQLAQNAGLADVVKGLQERVEQLAKMPDDRKSPLLNGSLGGGVMPQADDELVQLHKAVDEATTPVAKAEAQQRLAYAAVKGRFAR
jgi:hypothetical protein